MTIIAAVIIFGLLIFVHEFGHFMAAKAFGVRVHEFSVGMGPKIFKKNKGETDYSLRLLPIGGFVKLEGEDFHSEDERAFNKVSPIKRIIILLAGAVMNILVGFLIFVFIFSFSQGINVPEIAKVREGTPAEAVGLMEGDRITAINGKKINIYVDIPFSLYENGANEAKIDVERSGEKLTFQIIPQRSGDNFIIGIEAKFESPSFGNVLHNAYHNTFFVIRVVFVSLRELIFGRVSVTQMSGPVGIVSEIGEAAKSGFLSILSFAALIAVNLGIMNVLPLPALDGGRVIFVLLEMLRRKPLKSETEGYVHTIGFVILMLLMLAVTYSDIVKLFA